MAKKPNLLFIFTDEQAAATMAAYGNHQIQTPNMNRLSEDCIVFQNCYVSQPVCTPSRSTLLTGLYPHTNQCIKNDLTLSADIPCLPEMGDFKDYKIAYHGKWHLGDEIFAQHGFEEWISIDDGYRKHYSEGRDKNAHSTYYHFLTENGFEPNMQADDGYKYFSRDYCARLPEEYTKPAYLAKEAQRFIRENKDNPFLFYINFFEPHMPYFGPRDEQYDPQEIPLPPNFNHLLDEKNPLKTRLLAKGYYERGHSYLPLKTEDDWKRVIANYWGLVSLVDTCLGRVIDTLKENGLYEDTIIVYTSDHGDMMGSHRLLAKCTMFEEAVKVPMLLKIPGINTGNDRVENPVSQVDVVPTLLEALGQEIPKHVQGYSWMPFLKKQGGLVEEDVFIEWNGANNGFVAMADKLNIPDFFKGMASEEEIKEAFSDPVRTVITAEGWKLNFSPLGEHELYHLREDPYETNNLAFEQEYQKLIGKLHHKIINWQKRTKDTPKA